MADTNNNLGVVQGTGEQAPASIGISPTKLTPSTPSTIPSVTSQPLGISTEAAKRVLGAAGGSPLATAAAPIGTNIREATVQQAAQAQTTEALDKAKTAEARQKQQESEIANQLSEEALRVKEQALSTKQKFASQTASLIQDLRQNMGRIDAQREESKLQQAGFLLRLNNEKYISRLQAEGARKRLTNSASFKEEVLNTVFQNQIDLMDSSLRFKQLLRADDRNFERQLAEMDVDLAWDIMVSSFNEDMTTQRYKALGTGVTAAIQAGYNYSKNQPSTNGTSSDGTSSVENSVQSVPASDRVLNQPAVNK